MLYVYVAFIFIFKDLDLLESLANPNTEPYHQKSISSLEPSNSVQTRPLHIHSQSDGLTDLSSPAFNPRPNLSYSNSTNPNNNLPEHLRGSLVNQVMNNFSNLNKQISMHCFCESGRTNIGLMTIEIK